MMQDTHERCPECGKPHETVRFRGAPASVGKLGACPLAMHLIAKHSYSGQKAALVILRLKMERDNTR